MPTEEAAEAAQQQPTKINENSQHESGSNSNIAPPIVLPFEILTDPIRGRGLFATQDLPPNSLLHVAPCIVVSKEEYEDHAKHTCLEHYLFHCKSTGEMYLALGYGSLFNHHSTSPNVTYRMNPESREIRYSVGYRPVKRGEELFISYGSRVWFDDETAPKSSDSGCPEDSDADDDPGEFLSLLEV